MEVRFVAYYSTSGANVAKQSRVSTAVLNGIPSWRDVNKIEFMRNGFLEMNIQTAYCDFVQDGYKDSGIAAGWLEAREKGSDVVQFSGIIEMIQTYVAGSNNVIAIRFRPGTSFQVG